MYLGGYTEVTTNKSTPLYNHPDREKKSSYTIPSGTRLEVVSSKKVRSQGNPAGELWFEVRYFVDAQRRILGWIPFDVVVGGKAGTPPEGQPPVGSIYTTMPYSFWLTPNRSLTPFATIPNNWAIRFLSAVDKAEGTRETGGKIVTYWKVSWSPDGQNLREGYIVMSERTFAAVKPPLLTSPPSGGANAGGGNLPGGQVGTKTSIIPSNGVFWGVILGVAALGGGLYYWWWRTNRK
jgi:hypothetical protein